MPWVKSEVEKELDIKGEILFVVDPRPEKNAFGVTAVHSRFLFPTEWRGVNKEELKKETGLAGARFVHFGGHLAILENKEDALTLVNMVLKTLDDPVSERNSMIKFVRSWFLEGKREEER